MSSPGFFYTPTDQTQIDALERQRKLALALQQQGSQDPGDTPYAGLASAGKSLAGALLGRGLDQKERDITTAAQGKYTTDMASFLKGGAAPPPQPPPTVPASQISNAAGPDMPTEGPQTAPQAQASTPSAAAGQTANPAPMSLGGAQQPAPQQSSLDRLLATGNPALIQQFAPQLFTHQLDVNDRKVIPLTDQEAIAAGLRPGGVYGREAATGNLTTIQPSDLKSAGAIGQQQGEELFKNKLPMTAAQRAEVGVSQANAAETARHNKIEETIAQNPFGTGMSGSPTGATGPDFLKTLPPGLAAQIQAVGTYRQPAPAGRTSPTGIKFMTLVNQAFPDYDASQYGAKTKARNDFTTGKNGNTVRSLNVAVQHLDQLGQLSDALGNGNVQLFNKIGQAYAQQTGNPAPTNFDAAKQIVGDEIVKAVVGTGGTGDDRDKAAASISRASSPQQLAGVIKTYQGLMSGQLGGLKQQYEKSTGLHDFEDYLAPETKAKLQAHATGGNAQRKVVKFGDLP